MQVDKSSAKSTSVGIWTGPMITYWAQCAYDVQHNQRGESVHIISGSMQYSSVVIVSYLCDFGRDILFVILSSLVKLDALRENTQKHIQIECGREGLGLWLGLIHSRACYLRSSTCSTDRTSSAGISSNQPCITNTNTHINTDTSLH